MAGFCAFRNVPENVAWLRYFDCLAEGRRRDTQKQDEKGAKNMAHGFRI